MPQTIDYDQLADAYARNRRVHPEVVRSLLTTGRVGARSRVLEVGCGTGNYVVALQEMVSCACWGVDPSQEMLARAGERSGAIRLQRGRAEQLDFGAAFFDLVFSVDVIHHVQDRAAYYREARRTLKPGGKVCTVTDSAWIIRHRQPLSEYFPETVDLELARYPRLEELAELMAEAGFAEIGQSDVEFAYPLRDSGPYRAKAFSALHLISRQAFECGLERLEADLERGPVACVSRYVLLWGTGR